MTNRITSISGLPFLAVVGLAILQLPNSAGANVGDKNRDNGPIVVELFTSEGCSSCPPADALLQQIDGKQTRTGRRIIGISEHVTYWNHLGWSDPFSNDAYTQRQEEYRKRFHLESVYTPQMVIDGEVELVGSDHGALQRELEQARKPQPSTVEISAVIPREDVVEVDYSLTGTLPVGGADLVAVVADDEVRSNVARGENSGRVLTHVAVARSITRLAATGSPHDEVLQISIPRSASPAQKQSRRLILFVQAKGQGRVLGADERSF